MLKKENWGISEKRAFLIQGFPKDFAFLIETEEGEERKRLKCWQQELRAEQGTAPGLHCSAFPGGTEPFSPLVGSFLKLSRERKRWEMKGSLHKSRQQEKERTENEVGENREGL